MPSSESSNAAGTKPGRRNAFAPLAASLPRDVQLQSHVPPENDPLEAPRVGAQVRARGRRFRVSPGLPTVRCRALRTGRRLASQPLLRYLSQGTLDDARAGVPSVWCGDRAVS